MKLSYNTISLLTYQDDAEAIKIQAEAMNISKENLKYKSPSTIHFIWADGKLEIEEEWNSKFHYNWSN